MVDPNSVKSIFLAAVEKPLAERAAFLEQTVVGDDELRARVEALLKAHDNPDSFLEEPVAGFSPTVDLSPVELPLTERPGTLLGPYKLLQKIGEGGMGVVFMAEQFRPVRRTVALKIIKPGMDTKQVIARFEAERQALALMDHPNIAKVLDAGATESGLPYFVMELVKGVPITQYCDEHHLTPRDRLELLIPVCQAVQHAHQKGIIHRDLKPSNVMIALYDGRPVPKIIDFGVVKATGSKLTERTMFTEFGAIVGTLEYMSPEQAELNQLDVDTRSDIYSLGVLLYELLTGTTPLDRKRMGKSALVEVLRLIREEEPDRPSTRINTAIDLPSVAENRGMQPANLEGVVRGELDWIVMKALEKDRNRRYETANGLSRDIQRYLANEPVEACPPSATYRFRKYARRHKVALLTTALVAASLVLGTVISVWQATLARRAQALAQTHLVAEQAARQQASAEATKATTVSNLLQNMLGSANPDEARGADYKVRELLDDFSARLSDQLKGQPETEAAIRATVGNAYRRLGLLDKAEPQLKAALELRQRIFGQNHAEVAASLYDYAWYLCEATRYAETEEMLRQALAIHEKLDLENGDTIKMLSLLQMTLDRDQHFQESEAMAQQALEMARRQPQSDQEPEVANILHRLAATIISNNGDLARAERLARESVELHRKLHGNNHPETAWGLQHLGRALASQKKWNEAEKNYREALEIFLKQYDNRHMSVSSTLGCLASALSASGDQAGLAALIAKYDMVGETDGPEFGLVTGTFPIDVARGKHVSYSGWIKTENVDNYAGLWWRADGPNREMLAFGNMASSGPSGTKDWDRYTIELDIPQETEQIVFGFLMPNKGQAWFDGLEVKLDGEVYQGDHFDFDFELQDLKGLSATLRKTYRTQLDSRVAKLGKQSVRIESVDETGKVVVHREVAVDPKICAEYVGRYQVTPGVQLVVSQEENKLMVQIADQRMIQVYAESETQFFYKNVDAEITFERDETGKVHRLTLHQNGEDYLCPKLSLAAGLDEVLGKAD